MSKFTVNRQILTREVTVDGGSGGTVRCPTVRRYAATVTRGRVNNAAQRTVPSMGQRQDEPTNKETPIESARRYLAREQPKRERKGGRGALANLSGKRKPEEGPTASWPAAFHLQAAPAAMALTGGAFRQARDLIE